MKNKEFITITNEDVYKEVVSLRKDITNLKIQVATISALASLLVTLVFNILLR